MKEKYNPGDGKWNIGASNKIYKSGVRAGPYRLMARPCTGAKAKKYKYPFFRTSTDN